YALLSPTVRPFTLGLFLSLFSLVLTIRMLRASARAPRRLLRGGALGLATTAALLTWYLQLFVLLLELLLCLDAWRTRREQPAAGRTRHHPARPVGAVSDALMALAGGVLLALPWYGSVLPRLLQKLHQGATVTEGAPVLPSLPMLLAGLPQTIVGLASGPLAVAALAGWLAA